MHDRADESEIKPASLEGMAPFAGAVIDALPTALAVLDGAGIIVGVNRAWRELHRNVPESFPSGTVGVDYAREMGQLNSVWLQCIERIIAGELPEYCTEQRLGDSGANRWFTIGFRAIPQIAGSSSARVMVSLEDVTDHRQADESRQVAYSLLESLYHQRSEALEQANTELLARNTEHRDSLAALRESNERLRLALRSGLMGTWEIDIETNEVTRSDSTDVLFGLMPGGRSRPLSHYLDRMHRDDVDGVMAAIQQGITAGTEQYAEYRVMLDDGAQRWLASRGEICRENGTGRALFAGASMDITSRKVVEEALRDSEERYRLLFGSNPHPMWVYDLTTLNIIEVNDAALQFYGYSHQEFLSMTIRDLRPAEESPKPEAFISNVQDNSDARGIWRHRKKDGALVSVEVISHALALPHVKARLILANDITDRLAAEESVRRVHAELEDRVEARTAELARTNDALRESEELFRQLAENVGEVFWMTDIGKRRMIYVSPAYESTWGRTCQSLYARPGSFLDAIVEEDRPKVIANLPAQATGERMVTYRINASDGTMHWIRDRSFPIHNRAGEVYRIAGIAENITDLKKTEAELSRLACIAESSDDAIIGKSLSGHIISWNSGARRIYGYTGAEVVGRSALCLAPPELHAEAMQLMARVSRGEQVASVETTRVRKDGERLSVSMTLSAVRDAEGRVFAISCIERDITEKKRLEQEILEIGERERQRIGRDLHDDLGQLLTGISCLSKAVQQELAGHQRAEAKDVGQIADLVQQAIGQTRALARGLHPVQASPGGLRAALKELANQVNAIYRVRCQFVCRRPATVEDNHVATHLYRIAQEAINNAIKHGHARSVRLVLEDTVLKGTRQLALRVEDDGCGIKKINAPCPSPVSNEDSSLGLPPADQCGMGLRIMSYRARMIGATLSICPGPVKGTIVTCRLAAPATWGNKSALRAARSLNNQGDSHVHRESTRKPQRRASRNPS